MMSVTIDSGDSPLDQNANLFQTIEQAYEQLVRDGAEEWPQAWCEEELEIEREQRLTSLDYEIEQTEEHLAKLKHELKRWL